MAWQQIGYMMIIYIAGLQAVKEDILEAARVDGASSWQTLWKVTMPNVMPSITICTFLTLTNSFKLFDQNLALTAGVPCIQPGARRSIPPKCSRSISITRSMPVPRTRGVGPGEGRHLLPPRGVIAFAQLYATRRKEVQQ
ncbi:MAG: sugar ABC transporter permease [Oscillospiraceae bacterium]